MAKKSKNKNKGGASGAAMVVYKGPITARPAAQPPVRLLLKNKYFATSNSAGFLEVWNATSQATSLPEWASFAGLYREYRVLGLRFEYAPAYDSGGYIGSSNTLSVGSAAVYHGPQPAWTGAVTSSSDLNTWMMEGAKPFHPGKSLVLEWRMNDVEEAQFFSTSSSYQSGGIYALVPTVTASRTYGSVFVSFLIEFKGRV